MIGALGDLPEVIDATTDEIRNLADRYIESGALPKDGCAPMRLHIAAATVAGVDVLASWNFRHMVNLMAHPAVQRGEPPHGVSARGDTHSEGA